MIRQTIAIGASISCAGVCLTVVTLPDAGSNARWFEVEAWEEALRLTTAAGWQAGTRINLERALKIGDELGGHIVSGHVDGMAEIVAREDEGEAVRFTLRGAARAGEIHRAEGLGRARRHLAHRQRRRRHALRRAADPPFAAVTTWGERKVGDRVNLEVDTMARYAARLAEAANEGLVRRRPNRLALAVIAPLRPKSPATRRQTWPSTKNPHRRGALLR